jgi:phosphatidylglycerophosphate synthase
VTAGAGFLLAVLWFDLMFDVQVMARSGSREVAVESIAAYYRRVTTAARPMSRLIAAVMVGTIAAIVAQVAGNDAPDWAAWTSLVLAGSAISTAVVHTFPTAVRLGSRRDAFEDQERLSRSILRDHLGCLVAIVALLVIQLGFAG